MKSYCSFILVILFLFACKEDDVSTEDCMPEATLLTEFKNNEGQLIRIYDNGDIFLVEETCSYEESYFTPGFFEDNYLVTDTGVVAKVDEFTFFKPFVTFTEDFEVGVDAFDLFIENVNQRDRLFTAFTLQSPSTPSVQEYVDLRNCILEESCDFIDNRFDIAEDPEDASNKVVKFFSMAPTKAMNFIAKTSISTGTLFFEKGDDFWFEARYYLEEGIPTTLADFESGYFFGFPGPRILVSGGHVTIENKFHDKVIYRQPPGQETLLPMKEWVTIKVHLQYDEANGVIQVWQDGEMIIDARGVNMPLDFWFQSNLEVGITATTEQSTLYMDDMRFSDKDFD